MCELTMFDVTEEGKKLINEIVHINNKLGSINELKKISTYAELSILYCQLSSVQSEVNRLKNLCNEKMQSALLNTNYTALPITIKEKKPTGSSTMHVQAEDKRSNELNIPLLLPTSRSLSWNDHAQYTSQSVNPTSILPQRKVKQFFPKSSTDLKSYEEIIKKFINERSLHTYEAEILLVWLPYELAAPYLAKEITEPIFTLHHRKKYTESKVIRAIQEKWQYIKDKTIQDAHLQQSISMIDSTRQLRYLCWLLNYDPDETLPIKEFHQNVKQLFNLKDKES